MSSSLEQHLFEPGKKRILAIDGGGARGILACGILERIEALLADRLPPDKRKNFRLHHYYDLIGGTSTGSILAAGLCMGLKVSDLKKLYLNLCPIIFKDRNIRGVQKPRFEAQNLEDELNRVLREKDGRPLPMNLSKRLLEGDPMTLGSAGLHTGLAIFAKRIDTGGVWSLTNNPKWTFYDDEAAKPFGKDGWAPPNKNFSLAKLVQASTAAPTYFESVGIKTDMAIREGSKGRKIEELENGVFVDGALSGRNTPALQMLFMVTHPAFGFNWETGDDKLLMTSVGTGWWRPKVTKELVDLKPYGRLAREAAQAIDTLQTMIHDSSLHALTMLQSFSRHPENRDKRWTIDGEVDDLYGYLLSKEPLLRFRRMDVRLESRELTRLFDKTLEQELEAEVIRFGVKKSQIRKALYHIGDRYARRWVDSGDFPEEFDPPSMRETDEADTLEVLD